MSKPRPSLKRVLQYRSVGFARENKGSSEINTNP